MGHDQRKMTRKHDVMAVMDDFFTFLKESVMKKVFLCVAVVAVSVFIANAAEAGVSVKVCAPVKVCELTQVCDLPCGPFCRIKARHETRVEARAEKKAAKVCEPCVAVKVSKVCEPCVVAKCKIKHKHQRCCCR